MASGSDFHKLGPHNRGNESRLELAYQRVLLNHEKNEKLLLKRIEQLESNQRNLIIERNMLRTKLCKQTGELSDLNWRVTRYEISSYKNNKRYGLSDKENWALTSKKRVWAFLSSHGIHCKPHTIKGDECSGSYPSDTGNSVTSTTAQPALCSSKRSATVSELSGHGMGSKSLQAKPQGPHKSPKSVSQSGIKLQGADCVDETISHVGSEVDEQVGLMNHALELAREMSSYRCYIKSAVKKIFGNYEPTQGGTVIDQNRQKMRVLPCREDEGTINSLENGVEGISLVTNAALKYDGLNKFSDECNVEFDNMDSVACPPRSLMHLDSRVGLIKSLETYQNMLYAFFRTCNAMQGLITDLRSVISLMKASQNENCNLRRMLDESVSSKEVYCSAPEDIVILINKALKCPHWVNDAVFSVDASVTYPGDSNKDKKELAKLCITLSEVEDERLKLLETVKRLELQLDEVSKNNTSLSEKCLLLEESANSAESKYLNELEIKENIIRDLRSQCDALSDVCSANKTRLNTVEGEIHLKEETLRDLSAKLSDHESKNAHLEVVVNDKNAEIDLLCTERDQAVKLSVEKEVSFKEMIEERDRRLNAIATEKQTIENTHKACCHTIDTLKLSLLEKQDELDAIKQKHTEELETLKTTNLSLKQVAKFIEKQLAGKKDELEKLSNEYYSSREEYKNLLETERRKLLSQIEEYKKAHSTSLKELSSLKEDNNISHEKLNQLREQLTTTSHEVFSLRAKNEELVSHTIALESKLTNLRNRKADLENKLDATKSESSDAVNKCKKEAEEVLSLKSKEFNKRERALQGEISDARELINSINSKHQQDMCSARNIIRLLTSKYKGCLLTIYVITYRLNAAALYNASISKCVKELDCNIKTVKPNADRTFSLIESLNLIINEAIEKDTVNGNLISGYVSKIDELSKAISNKDTAIEDSRNLAIRTGEEVSLLNRSISDLRDRNRELESLIIEIRAGNEKNSLEHKNKITEALQQLDEANTKFNQLSLEFDRNLSLLQKVEESEAALKVKLSTIEKEKCELSKNFSDENRKLMSRNTELTRTLAEVNERLQKVNIEFESVERELLKTKNSKVSIANDLSDLREKYASLQNSSEELRKNNISLSNSLSVVMSDKSKAYVELEALNSEICQLKISYEKRITQTANELEETIANLKASQDKISLMESEIFKKDSQHKHQAKQLELEINRLKEAAKENHASIVEKLIKAESSIVIAQAKIRELTESNEALATEVKSEKEKLLVSESIIKAYGVDIGSKVFDLKSELKVKTDMVDSLNKDLDKLRLELECLREVRHGEHKNSGGSASDELSRLRNEVASLRFERHRSVFEMFQTVVQYKERISELEKKLAECSAKSSS